MFDFVVLDLVFSTKPKYLLGRMFSNDLFLSTWT